MQLAILIVLALHLVVQAGLLGVAIWWLRLPPDVPPVHKHELTVSTTAHPRGPVR